MKRKSWWKTFFSFRVKIKTHLNYNFPTLMVFECIKRNPHLIITFFPQSSTCTQKMCIHVLFSLFKKYADFEIYRKTHKNVEKNCCCKLFLISQFFGVGGGGLFAYLNCCKFYCKCIKYFCCQRDTNTDCTST